MFLLTVSPEFPCSCAADKARRALRKPGSVSKATISLGSALRRTSSDRTRRSAGRIIPPYSVLLRTGFTEPVDHPTAGGLLPHLFTLTGAEAPAVCFCGTFLELTLTGRYPASCPVEPGLSSLPPSWDSGRLPRSPRNLGLYHEIPSSCPRATYLSPGLFRNAQKQNPFSGELSRRESSSGTMPLDNGLWKKFPDFLIELQSPI